MLVEQEPAAGGDGVGRSAAADPGTRGAAPSPREGAAGGRLQLGVVGGHPIVASGLASALSGTFEVLVAGALSPRTVVVADLSCAACAPSAEELAALARRHRVVMLVGMDALGLAEEGLERGAAGAVGAWEPLSELRLALRSAATGEAWVSPAVAACGARLRGVRALLSGQELEVLRLYGADLPVKSVARRMGITVGTAKEYLKRLRAKLAARGVPVTTKVDLRVLAEELGLLAPQVRCGTAAATGAAELDAAAS